MSRRPERVTPEARDAPAMPQGSAGAGSRPGRAARSGGRTEPPDHDLGAWIDRLRSPRRAERDLAAVRLAELGEGAVPHLCRLLRGSNGMLGRRVVSVLVRIGPPAVAGLTEMLRDREVRARRRAAEALRQIRCHTALPDLLRALKDRSTNVRATAARALGEAGEASAVGSLVKCLRSRSLHLQEEAVTALGRIGDSRATLPLCDLLNSGSHLLRVPVAVALGRIAEKDPTPGLRLALPRLRALARRRFLGGGGIFDETADRIEAATEEMRDLPVPSASQSSPDEALPVPAAAPVGRPSGSLPRPAQAAAPSEPEEEPSWWDRLLRVMGLSD